MPKPVCISCGREFRVKKIGVRAQENIGANGEPYKIWSADIWECPKCLYQIISGYGSKPMSNVFDKDFKQIQETVEIIFY